MDNVRSLFIYIFSPVHIRVLSKLHLLEKIGPFWHLFYKIFRQYVYRRSQNFPKKSAQKWPIFSSKARFERSLFLRIAILE
jgi:hypothetical protein